MKCQLTRRYIPLFFIVISIFINNEINAQAIKLSWAANPENDIMYYSVYKDTTSSPQIEVSKISATDTTYIDNNIVMGQKYYYRIAAVDSAENVSDFSDEICITAQGSTSITNESGLPQKTELSQNYPNPFNAETTIKFTIAKEGQINLVILDLLGREVKKLANEYKNVGSYDVIWDGKDNHDKEVSTGVYFYRMSGYDFIKVKKIMLTK